MLELHLAGVVPLYLPTLHAQLRTSYLTEWSPVLAMESVCAPSSEARLELKMQAGILQKLASRVMVMVRVWLAAQAIPMQAWPCAVMPMVWQVQASMLVWMAVAFRLAVEAAPKQTKLLAMLMEQRLVVWLDPELAVEQHELEVRLEQASVQTPVQAVVQSVVLAGMPATLLVPQLVE